MCVCVRTAALAPHVDTDPWGGPFRTHIPPLTSLHQSVFVVGCHSVTAGAHAQKSAPFLCSMDHLHCAAVGLAWLWVGVLVLVGKVVVARLGLFFLVVPFLPATWQSVHISATWPPRFSPLFFWVFLSLPLCPSPPTLDPLGSIPGLSPLSRSTPSPSPFPTRRWELGMVGTFGTSPFVALRSLSPPSLFLSGLSPSVDAGNPGGVASSVVSPSGVQLVWAVLSPPLYKWPEPAAVRRPSPLPPP